MKETAGRVAADTLGYIAGNTPGAIAADIFYQKMYGKRKRTSVSNGTAKKRRINRVRRRVSTVGKNSVRDNSGNTAIGRRVGKPVAASKRTKVARLRTPVRAAIKKMIAGYDIKGTYRKVLGSFHWYGGVPSYGVTFDNKQKVEYTRLAEPFGPDNIIDAASILWNNKTPDASGLPANSLPDSYEPRALKLHVRNAYMKTTFKNNSKRAYHYKIYTCRPKRADVNFDPRGDWDVQLQANVETIIPTDAGSNVLSHNLEELGVTPKILPGWNSNWKCDVVTVVLQPGQTYTHYMQGPKDMEMDFAKFYQGGDYQKVQKFSAFLLCVYYGDLVGTSAGAVGHYEEIGDTADNTYDGLGVLVRQEVVYNLSMPELAGFKGTGGVAGAGVSVRNTQRRYAYASKFFMDPRGSGTVRRIDDEDPNTISDPT